MDFSIESLIPFEYISSDPDFVFSIIEKNGKAVLLKDNKPAYILLKYDIAKSMETSPVQSEGSNYTLQEAMKIVLSEAEDKMMHASKLADEIFERKLYLQKNGEKAQYTQVRARCGHYPEMFEALPGNFIKLREQIES